MSADAAKPMATMTCKKIGRYSFISLNQPGCDWADSDRGGSRSGRGDRLERGELLRNALVLLAVLFDHAAGNQVLKLLVSAQAQHFFTATRRITVPEILVNDIEELLEFVIGFSTTEQRPVPQSPSQEADGRKRFSCE